MKKYLFFMTVLAFAVIWNAAFSSTAYAGDPCKIRSDQYRVDGCSGPWLPNVHMEGINIDLKKIFKPSCDKHDQCYNTLNCPKEYCDNVFKHKMDQTCGRVYHYDPVTIMGHNAGDKNAVQREACLKAATMFYEAVHIGGQSSYDNDQRNLAQ